MSERSERTNGHAGEDLSALLDGELDLDAAAVVRDHLASCTSCASELDDVRAARAALRSLPGLDPPAALTLGVGAGGGARVVALRERRRRTALASVAASAAALAVLALGTSGGDAGSGPDTGRVLADHAASVLALSEGGKMTANGGIDPLGPPTSVTATTEAPRAIHGLPAPFLAPLRLEGGYVLVEAFRYGGGRRGPGLHLVYEHGPYALSVFETVGKVDFASLPAGGGEVEIAGERGWRQESPAVGGRLVIFEMEGLAVTVAGDEPGRAVLDAAGSLPQPRSLSVAQRVSRRCADALAQLAGAG